jgi:D-beta-D-heptose 7-phosphate kinase/D-beta-D-heptose 1-phosphate adenosyltransferase
MAVADLEHLSQAVESFSSKANVLCVGDLILDYFIYGSVERISPEAPVPVLQITRESHMLGGAGNVVRNVASLGGSSHFIAAVGRDDTAKKLATLLREEAQVESYLQAEKDRLSAIKTRYIAGNQQLLRADKESAEALAKDTEQKVIRLVRDLATKSGAIVLSDYAKGVLTPAVVKDAIATGKKLGIPVIVDPKQKDFSYYKGASIITPNAKELAAATGLATGTTEEVTRAARQLIKQHGFGAVLVTRGKHGMMLVRAKGTTLNVPTIAQEVFDVSGAGDTVVAMLALSLASGLGMEDAVQLANMAAGIVVGRLGTAAVTRTELKTALLTQNLASGTRKILPRAAGLKLLSHWRDQGHRIGFTNGCFDLIHPGHVSLMEQAKSKCDKLVVGLNSDDSVRRLKGPERPVQNEMARALVLASLEAVDMVLLFREDTPIELIKSIRPDTLIKGADYTVEKVVGADFVQSYGGKVHLAKLSKGQSTTGIVKKLRA